MKENLVISFIGGDLRQVYMIKNLVAQGFVIGAYCVADSEFIPNVTQLHSLQEACAFSNIIVGPMPFSKTTISIQCVRQEPDMDIEHLLSYLTPDHILFGGNFPSQLKSYCLQKNITMVDYLQKEEVAVLNAIATAEGAIAEAITRSPLNLCNQNTLVLGYGKCGSVLAQKLKGLDANVTICARNSVVLAKAQCIGFDTLPFSDLRDALSKYLFIFNTIPCEYFDKTFIQKISKDATFIDIASYPGCIDIDLANQSGIQTALCLGLPGRYAPKSSADILTNVLLQSLDSVI